MYARHRNDNNKAEIIKALREAGCIVSDMSQAGSGFPDLLVQRGERWWPIEVKSAGGKLTPAEEKWWALARVKPLIAETSEQALEIVGL